jgi:N-acetylglucosamine malate deacetylase 1
MMADKPGAILAVGGHSADMEFTCGAILAKYRALGWRTAILHCTPGDKGHGTRTAQEYEEQKNAEAANAARILGAEVYYLPYKSDEFPFSQAAGVAIAQVMRTVKADIVITHWPRSGHMDHRNAALNTIDAMQYAGLRWMPMDGEPHGARQLYFAENWEDPFDYTPDLLVDVTSAFDTWHAAASSYELFRGGVAGFDYDGYYSSLLRLRGCQARTQYACGLRRAESMHPVVGEI